MTPNLSKACSHHLVMTLSYAFKFCFMNSVSFSPTLLSCFSTFLFSLYSFHYTFVCTTLTTTSIFGNSAFICTGIWDSFLLRSKRKVSAAEFVRLPKYKSEMKCREGIQNGNEKKYMSAKNCKCSGFHLSDLYNFSPLPQFSSSVYVRCIICYKKTVREFKGCSRDLGARFNSDIHLQD